MQTAMFCDFCGKHQDYVQYLIAGRRVHICDECVGICNEIIAAHEAKKNETPSPHKEVEDEQR